MIVTIKQAPGGIGGAITAPPSKSMAHRAVLCSALAKGTSHIGNLEFSKDISATLSAAGQLCAKVRTGPDSAVVEGLGRFLPVEAPVDCCESGSTLRFLIPIASLTGQRVTFVGRGRLMERPQSVYEALYHEQSLRFEPSPAGLTVEGALRTGAGIVTLASVEPVLAAGSARLPECCLCPCEPGAEGGISPQSIPRILRQKATVLLIGPGLGYLAQSTARAAETRTLVKKLLTGFSGSAVLDADGLNAAASLMNAGEELPRPAKELILTPHPGEMSRLTGLSVEAVQADREGVARRYAAQWNAVVVLKGARTVVAAPDGRVCVNLTGNPGLARGGSGDVLAGMTSALLACGLPAFEAAVCAVYLHGAAADRAAAVHGEAGMLPHDLFAALGTLFAENGR